MKRRDSVTEHGGAYGEEGENDGIRIRTMAIIMACEVVACGLWFAALVAVGGA